MKNLFLPFNNEFLKKTPVVFIERTVTFFLVLLSISAVFSRFFSELHWIPDIIAQFPVHLAIAALFFPVFYYKFRKPKHIIAGCLLCLFNISALFTSVGHEFPINCKSFDKPLTVVSANIYYRNNDIEGFRNFLKSEKPDIFATVEMTSELREVVWDVFGRDYRYTTYPVEWGIGIGLWSKYRIDNMRYSLTRRHKVPYLIADVEVPGQTVTVVILHAISPGRGDQTPRRDAYLRHVAEVVSNIPDNKPVIVMGDFNTTRYTPIFSEFLNKARVNSADPIIPISTWPAAAGKLGVQIDHVMTKCLPEPELYPLTVPGSDHKALKAVFTPQ